MDNLLEFLVFHVIQKIRQFSLEKGMRTRQFFDMRRQNDAKLRLYIMLSSHMFQVRVFIVPGPYVFLFVKAQEAAEYLKLFLSSLCLLKLI